MIDLCCMGRTCPSCRAGRPVLCVVCGHPYEDHRDMAECATCEGCVFIADTMREVIEQDRCRRAGVPAGGVEVEGCEEPAIATDRASEQPRCRDHIVEVEALNHYPARWQQANLPRMRLLDL